ncbi:LysR family transcriptional regulator [Cohnella sp. AR92]|uniref:LysR family transcriptional regulator n=1 Tax=Cohnella sp. AR92 TaxID=648716 RepID=UPI000F8C82FF|nr:LysR family transcriptional regulator [Cohnella sp. AR92]RUS48887.1 LysR family transcriptional regulator [Cohnella sp. AR92]
MNLLKYQIFIHVVETGSLTKAGEVLNLTQSAISHAISGLEHELGLNLLIRNRSGVQLTDNGERLLHYFRKITQLNEDLHQEVALIKGIETGTVRIGTFSSVSISWLPGILKEYHDRFPLIETKILDGNYREIERWIATGAVDIGFVNLPVQEGLEAILLRRDRMLCILPADHPLGGQSTIRIDQIINSPFIMPTTGCDADLRRIFSQYKLSPNIKYELEDDHAIMSMVQNNLGVSILPETILEHSRYDLCKRPLEGEHFRSIGIAAVSFKSISPAAKKFVDYITTWVNKL